ncbi:MAG: hypothetical protein HFE80_10355 [Clostridiaceae bacterium]|jgi:hypothetical protein|nr:hypothetical protein [Clostridiaceae bacterium]
MKKKLWILAATVIILLLAGGGWFFLSQDRLSQGPQVVIDAMFTCPNPELFREDAVSRVGLGVETTPEEQEKIQAANEQMQANWEKAVGRYFAPNCFKPFFKMEATYFLGQGTLNGQKIAVEKTELEEKGFRYEKALVTYDADGQQAQARLKFSLDEDGLITQVEILETPAG